MSNALLAEMLMLGLLACTSAAAKEPDGDRVLDRGLVAGTLIEATIEDARAWRRNPLGETLTALVNADVRNAGGWVVIPAGATVGLRVARWRPPSLTFKVLSVQFSRRLYPMRETAVVVGSGTRIAFVLSERFTTSKRLGGIP